jgi:lipopolysaccharide/colanic/teichoic acid biosynthesis glycosyltransferase
VNVAKRIFDLAGSAIGLLVLSPLFVIIAVVVKLSSPGPVFFRQERMGRGFTRFRIFKFRTMIVNDPDAALVTVRGDPRITTFGRFLRKAKLDELPQLINVLKGDMSLVGPRPEVPQYVEMFRDDYAEILTIRPGITDQASVRFRDEEGILAASDEPAETYVREVLPRKIALAKEYNRERTFLLDLLLIFRTIARF